MRCFFEKKSPNSGGSVFRPPQSYPEMMEPDKF